VLTALVFEWIWKTRLAGLGGAVLGFIFMVIAHKAPVFDSAIKPLMPALQSSWLTYHVVTIMLSYSAFALSFFAALCYLAKDAFGGDRAPGALGRMPAMAALDLFNYRIIAVGFPLLTLGIVFGAVWADTAWGRPWGFDPKETWSAITWLIYAIYLHVRYLAGWQGRRASLLALAGFGAVLFTYLGVNFLLPGLHSYA
jgi:cytochrome c-type biogenesis protein CcsB